MLLHAERDNMKHYEFSSKKNGEERKILRKPAITVGEVRDLFNAEVNAYGLDPYEKEVTAEKIQAKDCLVTMEIEFHGGYGMQDSRVRKILQELLEKAKAIVAYPARGEFLEDAHALEVFLVPKGTVNEIYDLVKGRR